MIYFSSDYCEGCHPRILERMVQENFNQMSGYGADAVCARAAQKIRALCCSEDADVHFLVGGTQANLTVIDAALRPYQAAVGAVSAHINAHETGAVEATGHKILTLPATDGKITAAQIRALVSAHWEDGSREHTAQPKLVYLSNSTELGTIYSRRELELIRAVCDEFGLYLFVDGARLGYALTAKGNDLTMADLARLCDAFYIGGTKVGALFGEAVVLTNPALKEDFRYLIKQHGGMLAKGWLLGQQFDTLLTDGLYFSIAAHANAMADQIRDTLSACGIPLLVKGTTNQIFPILSDRALEKLEQEFVFTEQSRIDECHRAIRICTSWATMPESVEQLCCALTALHKQA